MAAARSWIALAGAFALLHWAEAGNVRGGGRPSDRRLSSNFNTTVPALTGCFTIQDRNLCCLHHDLRGDDRYDWEQCAPAGPFDAFSSGNVCEPACWTKGACGSGKLQAAVGACHGLPDFGFSSEYTFGQKGSTCEQQGMSDVSEAECQAASAGSGSGNSRAAPNAPERIVSVFVAPSTVMAPSGCIWMSPPFSGLLVYKGTRGSGEVGANTRYLCAARSFEASPATHAPTPAPTAAPTEAPTRAPTTAPTPAPAPGCAPFNCAQSERANVSCDGEAPPMQNCGAGRFALVNGVTDGAIELQPPQGLAATCADSRWVQIDLVSNWSFDTVVLFGLADGMRAYCGRRVDVSFDGLMWTTVFDMGEEYSPLESVDGTSMTFPLVAARFVRVFSSRSTTSAEAHFLEVEVRLVAPGPTPSPPVQAPGWVLYAANSFCQAGNPNFVVRSLISGTSAVSTVEECQLRAESDFNCGNDRTAERLVVTNAEQGVPIINGVAVPSFAGGCGCIIPGMQCVVRPTEQGNSIYVLRAP